MEEDLLKEQMRAFDRWKAELIQVIQDYHHWLESHDESSAEIDVRLFDVIESLKSDQMTIAFVAEFSRGKTELINAIFFSDYKRRLLPSEAGRTTMCPTELFYDREENQAYIRLLPIETRLEESSISELKKDTSRWKTINLDINSPDQMVEALKEVITTKNVPMEEAIKMGLYSDNAPRRRKTDDPPPLEIEIPQWRHALISFPHPLLQQGLAILDTPGLNALGTEPELTLNMLPNAQAVLFVLAADTGVTQSDLEVWDHYIKEYRGAGEKGLVAALNKVDTLWDEMKDQAAVDASIEAQRNEVANALSIDNSTVFPVSAQKALLAKTKDNNE
jgi:replication fork clamp-binding protein CrfC